MHGNLEPLCALSNYILKDNLSYSTPKPMQNILVSIFDIDELNDLFLYFSNMTFLLFFKLCQFMF